MVAERFVMPLSPKNRKKASRKIKLLRKEGVPQDQAIARGLASVRRKKKTRGPKGAKFE